VARFELVTVATCEASRQAQAQHGAPGRGAGTGTGWTFSPCTAEAFQGALETALATLREHPDSFRALQLRGMERDSSWDAAAQQYEQIFAWAKYDQPYAK